MTREWSEDRAMALVHPNRFTAEELAWLDVTDVVESNDQNPDMFLIDTQPEDSRTETKDYDIRKRPEVGD